MMLNHETIAPCIELSKLLDQQKRIVKYLLTASMMCDKSLVTQTIIQTNSKQFHKNQARITELAKLLKLNEEI